jgi:gas vesicle protein
VAGANRGRYFLIGLILGGVVGALIAVWIVESRRVRFRKQGAGLGSRVAEFIAVVKDEIIPGVREAIRQGMKEEGETAGESRSEEEERFRRESEI